MTDTFHVTIKQSVFESTGLNPEKYADKLFSFESETAAQEWVDELDNSHAQQGSLILHSAHPNDTSDADAYLIFDPATVGPLMSNSVISIGESSPCISADS